MKKMGWVVLIVIVLLLVPILLSKLGRPRSDTTPAAPPPPGAEPTAAKAPVSTEMNRWLDFAPQTVSITVAQDIRELTAGWSQMASMFIRNEQFSLTFEIDPAVHAMVTGNWRKTPMRTILDDICLRNNLKWHVLGPNTIGISPQSGGRP
jgi:hypothetical protein